MLEDIVSSDLKLLNNVVLNMATAGTNSKFVNYGIAIRQSIKTEVNLRWNIFY